MFAMITTEEYKELVLAKEVGENAVERYKKLLNDYQETQENLKELLLVITNGKTETEWLDKEFKHYDVNASELANYINENYMIDGKLQFEKVKENTDE